MGSYITWHDLLDDEPEETPEAAHSKDILPPDVELPQDLLELQAERERLEKQLLQLTGQETDPEAERMAKMYPPPAPASEQRRQRRQEARRKTRLRQMRATRAAEEYRPRPKQAKRAGLQRETAPRPKLRPASTSPVRVPPRSTLQEMARRRERLARANADRPTGEQRRRERPPATRQAERSQPNPKGTPRPGSPRYVGHLDQRREQSWPARADERRAEARSMRDPIDADKRRDDQRLQAIPDDRPRAEGRRQERPISTQTQREDDEHRQRRPSQPIDTLPEPPAAVSRGDQRNRGDERQWLDGSQPSLGSPRDANARDDARLAQARERLAARRREQRELEERLDRRSSKGRSRDG